MMVNPVVDGYTKTLNTCKIVRKLQKNNILLKTKRTLHKFVGVRFTHLACQGDSRPSSPIN